MAKQHNQEFKENAITYYQEHKDLGVKGCAENLGIGRSTLNKWLKEYHTTDKVITIGRGKYASDEQREIARLKRELRYTTDALNILKKAMGILIV